VLPRGFSFSRVKVLRKYGRITRKFHQYEMYNLLHALLFLPYYQYYGLTLQLLYINKITNDDDDTGSSECFVSRFSRRESEFFLPFLLWRAFSKLLNYELPSIFVLFFFFFFYSIVLFNNSIENPPGGGIGMLHAGHGYEYEFGPLSRACVTMCRLASSSHRSHMTCPHLGINVSTFTAKGLPCCTAAACSHAAMPTKSLLCHF